MDKGKTASDVDREKMQDDVEYRYIVDFVIDCSPRRVAEVLFKMHKETTNLKNMVNRLNAEVGNPPTFVTNKFDGDNYD